MHTKTLKANAAAGTQKRGSDHASHRAHSSCGSRCRKILRWWRRWRGTCQRGRDGEWSAG
ncbi:hypothetical protein I4F81_000007 [Pyropia yezoensis]|uniref:Uncharacterized protein n=1 Tax=Pyropia yezoensis TaxID=2788 RepID=A0ACC3BIN8_PYRYE|nr:hypothetical protein I4F81_000007 [Neopyropia yezoensis]